MLRATLSAEPQRVAGPGLHAGLADVADPEAPRRVTGYAEVGVRITIGARFWQRAYCAPLSRLRGEGGVGVSHWSKLIEFPPPAALCERVDLPRKRER